MCKKDTLIVLVICTVVMIIFAITIQIVGSYALFKTENRYPLPRELQTEDSASAAEKARKLWELHQSSINQFKGNWRMGISTIVALFAQDVKATVEHDRDYMPEDRVRSLSPVGVMTKVRINWDGQDYGYTGMFNKSHGSLDHNFIRLSSVGRPGLKGLAPSVAIKMFRDDKPSANLLLMYAMEGQNTSSNFFENPVSNHVPFFPAPHWGPRMVRWRFQAVTAFPTMLGLSDLALTDQYGNEVPRAEAKFPFALILQPSPKLTRRFSYEYNPLFENVFPKAFKGGEVLYKIYAVAEPNSAELQYLGHIKMESYFAQSMVTDHIIFFKHQLMEDDLELKPHWKQILADSPERLRTEGVPHYKHMLPEWDI